MSDGTATSEGVAVPDLDQRSFVYVVRPGENEELRYSLRSLAANVPHRDVWVVGTCLPWLRGVNRIELSPKPEKWANIFQSLSAACADDRISERFVLMNDDMFITSPITELPIWHLGSLEHYVRDLEIRGFEREHSWFKAVLSTQEQMLEWGFTDALSYEGHMPMPFDRTELASLIDRATHWPLTWGCFYSATTGPRGVEGANVKVAGLDSRELMLRIVHGQPFLSTLDTSFADGKVGEFIRNMFPDPGPYEEAA